MKSIIFVIFFCITTIILGQAAALENRDVYYSVNEIINHKDGVIKLKDNTMWKLNMPLITWSLQQAIMIKEKNENVGLGYIKGQQYQISYLGPYELTNDAQYLKVEAINKIDNLILLGNNEVYAYSEKEQGRIENCELPFYVVLDLEKKIAIIPTVDNFVNVALASDQEPKIVRKK